MAEQVLSKEELKALLDDGKAPKGERHVADYDFAHPTRLTREQGQALKRAHEAAAPLLANDLSEVVRAPLQVVFSGISEIGFAGLRASLPNPTPLHVLAVPPLPERGLLAIEAKLAFGLIDRLLGGPGKPPSALRPLTALERGLLEKPVKKIIERIAATWKEIAPFTPSVELLVMDPTEVDSIPSGEILVCATFAVAADGNFAGGEVRFCLPYIAIEPALSRLGKPVRFSVTKTQATPDQRKQIDLVLGKATLPVGVDLGTATLTIGEILAMAPGDVLVLDQGPKDLLSASVGGKSRVLGRAGRLGKRMALLVERLLPKPK